MRTIFSLAIFLFFSLNALSDDNVVNYYQTAMKAYSRNDFQEAAKYFKKVTEIQPGNIEAHFNLGGVYEKLEKYEQAVGELMVVVQHKPNDKEANTFLNICITKLINELINKTKNDPRNKENYIKLSHLFFEKKDYKTTVKYCNKVLEIDPKSPYIYKLKALSLFNLKDFDNAFIAIEKAFKILPDDTLIFELLQKITNARGKTVSSPVKIIKKETSSKNTNNNKLQKLLNSKKWDSAISLLKENLRNDPNNKNIKNKISEIREFKDIDEKSRLYYNRAIFYIKKEHWEDAEKRIILALKEKPNSLNTVEVYKNLCKIYKKLKEFNKLIEITDKLIKLEPDNPQHLFRKGNIYNSQDDKENALKYYNKALTVNPNYFNDHRSLKLDIQNKIDDFSMKKDLGLYLGILFGCLALVIGAYLIYNLSFFKKKRYYSRISTNFQQENWQYVIDIFNKLENLNYTRVEKQEIFYMVGYSYFKMERIDKAVTIFNKGLKFNPKNNKLLLALTKTYIKKEVFTTETLYLYKRFLLKEPQNMDILLLICKYYSIAKNSESKIFKQDFFFNEKIAVFKRILKLSPNNKEALNLLGEYYFLEKNTSKEAIPIYEKILKTDPENLKLLILLSETLLKNDQINNCIKYCQKIFNIDSSIEEVHNIFITAMTEKNEISEMIIEYENMLEIEPESKIISLKLNELRQKYAQKRNVQPESSHRIVPSVIGINEGLLQAKEQFLSGNINLAISQLKYLIARDPSNFSINLLLIKCYLSKGLTDLAYEQYIVANTRSELMTPEEKEICYRIGVEFEQKGKFKEALEMFDRICKIDISYKDAFDKFEEIYEFISK